MPVTENVIRLFARYSEGCRLAAEHGPTSGVVFEYAYQNAPHGSGTVGRWIDRTFLQLSAWNNLRDRVQVTKQIVEDVVAQRRAAGQSTVILDIASGTARYLREFASEHAEAPLYIACRDRDPRQVMHGRELSAREGLTNVIFSVGDATDQASYLTDRDADLVLATGLFPHLQRDEAVRTVMRLTFEHLTSGGTFVCTTISDPEAQLYPWETGFWNNAAVRSSSTIEEWLRATGFVGIEQRVSAADCFLIARKPVEHEPARLSSSCAPPPPTPAS
jgi:SAM-dependent methyltransferase